MQITMKSSSCAPTNWIAQLMNFGINATRRPSVFGRTAHVFKLQGEAVELLQDPQQTVSSVVEDDNLHLTGTNAGAGHILGPALFDGTRHQALELACGVAFKLQKAMRCPGSSPRQFHVLSRPLHGLSAI